MNQILVEMELLRDPYCGIGQVCHKLLREYISATDVPDGLSVLGADASLRERQKGIRLLPAWTYSLMKWSERLFPYGVWHCTNQDSIYTPKSRSTRFVLTIHDLNFISERVSDATFVESRLTHFRKLAARASVVVTDSQFVRRQVAEYLNVEDARTRCIPLGVDMPSESPPANTARHITEEKPFLFTIGFVAEKKNFLVLLDLLPALPEHFLVIAGSNRKRYAKRILERAIELGVQDRVVMPGTIDEKQKQWFFANCEAFVFPSLLEGFGIPVLEAMSHAKPVFCSTSTSLPEVAGDAAFYWDSFSPREMAAVFNHGMNKWRSDPTCREKALARAKAFPWSATARSYINLYREVLQS